MPDAPMSERAIVVGIDGSQASLCAFDWAVAEAAVRGAPVLAVHAVDAPSIPLGVVDTPMPVPSYSIEELEDATIRYLDRLVVRGRDLGVAVTPLVVRDARPANALTVLSRGAALLVVSSRGLGGMAGLLVGSVSKQCLRRSVCPVVVLPPGVAARLAREVDPVATGLNAT